MRANIDEAARGSESGAQPDRARRRLLTLALFLILIAYGLRFLVYANVFSDSVDLPSFTDATTLLALVIITGMFLLTSHLSRRLSRLEALFIGLFGLFTFVSIIQGAWAVSVTVLQIFLLPLMFRWVREVPSSTVKMILSIFAIVSAFYVIGEFIVLNERTLEPLPSSPQMVDWYQQIRGSLTTAGGIGAFTYADEFQRPDGVLAYVLTSGVSLAMLAAFFLFESTRTKHVSDRIIALLLVAAVTLSTSGTGIVSVAVTVVIVGIMTKPHTLPLGFRLGFASLVTGFALLVITVTMWPLVDTLTERLWEAVRTDLYRSSFIPTITGPLDIVRLAVGGNGWEATVDSRFRNFDAGWEYQGTNLLVRESNIFNLVALFGVVPMGLVFWRWLTPVKRMRDTRFEMDPRGLPFIAALLTGMLTMVHDNGVVHWNNIFYFYLYYEFSSHFIARRDLASPLGPPSQAKSQLIASR